MTSGEIRDCITPSITIAHSQSQIIFGIRFGFTSTSPGVWLRSTTTKAFLKSKKIAVTISNSKSTSGKMITAGYAVLKAPNTTHVHRYTQFLRCILPENTPYFDVLRYKKTPMDQLIPHLVIQCGEKHVAPLSQALLPVMTGKGIAMFILRYAFSTMTNEKIRSHFTFHEKWSKSLKAIPMSPYINHLDQVRTEYNEDGTTTARSTREWVASLLAPDGNYPALCDVVNGPPDHKAYLLVPSHYFAYAQNQWRDYKARLYPPTHREARYRDNLPGLPDVIHIQAEIESNVTFLEKLSAATEWQQAPSFTRHMPTQQTAHNVSQSQQSSTILSVAPTEWPNLSETSTPRRQHTHNSLLMRLNNRSEEDVPSVGEAGTSLGTEEDRSTASTRSLTHVSRTSIDTRFHELENTMKQQQKALEVSGKQTTATLSSIASHITRIDDLDKKLAAVTSTLDTASRQMEKSAKNQQFISGELQEMKSQHAKQFTELNNRLLTNMESQHKMSTTMLDIQAQFENISIFIHQLSQRMEQERKNALDIPQALTPPLDRKAPSAGSSTGSKSESFATQQSDESSAESIVHRSPDQKRQRSSGDSTNQQQQNSLSAREAKATVDNTRTISYMKVCTDLDVAFQRQDLLQALPPRVNTPSTTSTTSDKTSNNPTDSAPIDPLPTYYLDPAGARTL